MLRGQILLHGLQPSLQLLVAVQSYSLDFSLTSNGLPSWHLKMNWAPKKWQRHTLKGERTVNEEAEGPRSSNNLIHLWRDAGREKTQRSCLQERRAVG
jgi:hypothetical protein